MTAKAATCRHDGDIVDDDYDDDEYVEFVLRREPDIEPRPGADIKPAYEEESDTEPLRERVEHRRPAPADVWHSDPVDSWHSLLDHPVPQAHPIGFAHNGSHLDIERHLRPFNEFSTRAFRSAPRDDRLVPPSERHHNGSAHHQLAEGEAPRGQHHRPDPDDDSTSYGRHSSGN